jgi:RNA polymerase sigma-70 factor, ECF subfamily
MADPESMLPFPRHDTNGPSRRPLPDQRPVITAAQLERVYASYFDHVYGFIFARVGNREDAEDLTAQVFLKSLQYLDPSAAPQEVQAYLFRMARSALADFWRRYATLRVVPIDEEPGALEVEGASDGAAADSLPTLLSELERILALLPPQYRRVLELRFYEGQTIKQTARAMNITEANAKVLQYRAIQRAAAYARETEAAP